MLKPKFTNKSLYELKKFIKKMKLEMSVSSGAGAFQTPAAFRKDKTADGSEASEDPDPSTSYFKKPTTKKPKTFDVVTLHEQGLRGLIKKFIREEQVASDNNTRMQAILDMLNHAGEMVQKDDISVANKTKDTVSYDVYISGEPYQIDVDKDNQVYIYNQNKVQSLGFIANSTQLVQSYKKLKGI